ncbi:hypothetical protein Tco_1182638 [Tanacetum coccineum]
MELCPNVPSLQVPSPMNKFPQNDMFNAVRHGVENGAESIINPFKVVVVNGISNPYSEETRPVMENIFLKSFDGYIEWCTYVVTVLQVRQDEWTSSYEYDQDVGVV